MTTPTEPPTRPDTDVVVRLDGDHASGTRERAAEKVRSALRHTLGPVPRARVRIRRHPDPAARPPVIAEASVDVDGRPVRARVHADTDAEAIDRLEDRLRAHLSRQRYRHDAGWEDRRGAVPAAGPHEWRHGSPETPRPPYFPRPPEGRRILRHKTFTVGTADLDEATFDLDVLDHDFHLFTELGTGQDGVLYRTPEGLRLALVEPRPEALAPHAAEVTVSRHPAPVLSTDEAQERLGLLGLPFLFFLDAERGRGAVLYHRYDGHYGLITPAG